MAVLQQAGYLLNAVVSVDSAAWTSRFGQHINVDIRLGLRGALSHADEVQLL